MNQKLTIAVAGCGNRGWHAYASILKEMPEEAKIVAISDVVKERVEAMGQEFSVPSHRRFASAEEMLSRPKLADAVMICTQDRQHVKQALMALEKGYHILMEKPISPDLDECERLLAAARKTDRKIVVCHVLRYAPIYQSISKMLADGAIGELVSIQARENVAYYHQAHSFVRGNWRNSEETSPMIVQKCCHDMDIFVWLTGQRCKKLSSFGSLHLFKEENAPPGATGRCLDGCAVKESCVYDAEKIYITDPVRGFDTGNRRWPLNVLALHPDRDSVYEALRTGPYGRCVYYCDNDVVDHQVLNLEMENGCSISFSMCAYTDVQGRTFSLMGTKGCIHVDTHNNRLELRVYGEEVQVRDFSLKDRGDMPHGEADLALIRSFTDLLLHGKDSPFITSLEASMESHYMAVAAEQSRLEGGCCLEIEAFRSEQRS